MNTTLLALSAWNRQQKDFVVAGGETDEDRAKVDL
jgi:hypothetical protein